MSEVFIKVLEWKWRYTDIVADWIFSRQALKWLRACPFEWVFKSAQLTGHKTPTCLLKVKSAPLCLPPQHFDDSAPQRSCIVVIDNGKGMTPRQLNNWAIYRLSKFIRREKKFKGWDVKLYAEYSVCCCLGVGYVSYTVEPLVLAQNEKQISEKE